VQNGFEGFFEKIKRLKNEKKKERGKNHGNNYRNHGGERSRENYFYEES
jgi:hypothetical protein